MSQLLILKGKLSDYVSPAELATVFKSGDAMKLRQKPINPIKQNSQHTETPLTPRTKTVLCHIQRDLRSPATNMRMRAVKSIQSPPRSTYTETDELHVEQNDQPELDTRPSIQEVMKDIVVYVEVRSGVDNRSEGVSKVIEALGAQVNKRITRNTTHVVFKDGLLSTFKKARSMKIPVVSILWIEACKNERRICDPADFPISNIDRYEYPELYGKMKRYKFMQPGSECNKRVRAKKPSKESSPKSAKQAVEVKGSQSDITRYFKLQNNSTQFDNVAATPTRTPGGRNITESPATVLLNRMSSNTYTPLANMNKLKSMGKQSNELQNTESTPLNSRRKSIDNNINATTNSIAQMSICQTPETGNHITQTQRRSVVRRRRTLMPPTSKSTPNMERESPKREERNVILMTEEIVFREGSTSKGLNIQSSISRRTTYSYKPMEITESPQNVASDADAASCTPTESEHTKKTNSVQCINMSTPSSISLGGRRRTLFDLSMDIITHQVQNLNSKTRLSIAPNNAGPTPIRASNSDSCIKEVSAPTESNNSNELGSGATLVEQKQNNTVNDNEAAASSDNTTSIPTAEKKKRKLFKPIESSPFTPQGTPLSSVTPTPSSRKSISINSIATPKASVKRRRTLVPKQYTVPLVNTESDFSNIAPTVTPLSVSNAKLTRRSTMDFEAIKSIKSKLIDKQLHAQNTQTDGKENNSNLSNSNKGGDYKPAAKKRLPFLAFTNMHKEQVEVISEAVVKLGRFKLDRTVSGYTTHMVSLEARRTMNLLRGLVRGLWILDYKWVVDSLHVGYWLPEEPYEMKDFSRAVEICRAERQAFGNNYKCELFADLGAFFISPRCDNIPIRELKELIRLCGGKIEDHRHNAKYILSSCTKAYDDKIYVTPLWILDSITQMQLMRIQKYSALSQLPTVQSVSNTRNMPTAIEFKDPHRFAGLERTNKVVVDSRLSAIYSRT